MLATSFVRFIGSVFEKIYVFKRFLIFFPLQPKGEKGEPSGSDGFVPIPGPPGPPGPPGNYAPPTLSHAPTQISQNLPAFMELLS